MGEREALLPLTPMRRVEGLRNLRTGYDLVAAVGFWKELHGEDLIEVYADAVAQIAALTQALPRNLTHCATCDKPFPEPMTHWDDYFVELEDAGFVCESCPEVY